MQPKARRQQEGKDLKVTRKCLNCGGNCKGVKKDYRYVECGLHSVTLKNITVNVCNECGSETPEIPSLSGLHIQIMLQLIAKESLICGEEIRFLRKMARLNGRELAKLMGLTAVHLSRLENSAATIGAQADRVLRLICYTALLERLVVQPGHELTAKTAAAARNMPNLDIRVLLKSISANKTGPKRVDIDPRQINSLFETGAVDGPVI